MGNSFLSQMLAAPARLEVRDNENKWLATFTLGSYTVTMHKREESISLWIRLHPQYRAEFGSQDD
jgi:hypothetical protein